MADRVPDRADNEVFLRGVLACEPALRTLPSGDELCSFRITVPRPSGGRVRVDSIDCSTTKAAVRRGVIRLTPGEVIEVTGRLHRRFWRSVSGAPASRYEVDVVRARMARTAARRRAGPTPVSARR